MEEINSESENYQHRQFDQLVTIKLVVNKYENYFEELGIEDNPTFEPYYKDDRNGQLPDPPPEELDPTPEVGYNFIIT